MDKATDKQVIALKKFAKNKQLSGGVLKGVDFSELSKQEASSLIEKCYGSQNGFSNGLGEPEASVLHKGGGFQISFGQNYKNGGNEFKTVYLTDEEENAVRNAHQEHCIDVMNTLNDAYPDDRELQLAMFDKMADKIFTWIQQALDEKVRKARQG
jgi:hypothetical protein